MRKSKQKKIINYFTNVYKDLPIEVIKDSLFLYRLEFMIITIFNERAEHQDLVLIKNSIIDNLEQEQKKNVY